MLPMVENHQAISVASPVGRDFSYTTQATYAECLDLWGHSSKYSCIHSLMHLFIHSENLTGTIALCQAWPRGFCSRLFQVVTLLAGDRAPSPSEGS